MHKPALYTRAFLILCASHLLFSASFNMILPELPSYLSAMGGDEYKGWIIALFTIMAGISRPFSGKLTDRIGRMPVMVFGTLVCVICSLLYPILLTITGFLLLRFFHGFSTGFKPTAATAYVADMVPASRRGEAMGILGVSMNAGASISPPIGSMIANQTSINWMFMVSSLLAVVSVVILFGLKETLPNPEKFRLRHLAISKEDFFEPSAIAPAIVVLFIYITIGVLLTIVPDQCEHLGIKNKGLFFTSYTIMSIISRLVAGRASDRFGRVIVIKIAIAAICLSLLVMARIDSQTTLLLATGLLGFAGGIASPAVFAWCADRSPKNLLGRSMATIYIALEMSICFGALMSASIYQSTPDNFAKTFYITALFTSFGLIYLQFIYRPKPSS